MRSLSRTVRSAARRVSRRGRGASLLSPTLVFAPKMWLTISRSPFQVAGFSAKRTSKDSLMVSERKTAAVAVARELGSLTAVVAMAAAAHALFNLFATRNPK